VVVRRIAFMDRGVASRRTFLVPAILLTAAVYFVAAKLGLRLAFEHPSASPVWPATGIALAALVLLGSRLWPAVFVGAFFANLTTAGTVATSLGIAAGNTLEAVLGSFLLQKFARGARAFDRPGDVFRWTLLGAVLAPAVSATIGVGSLTLGGAADPSEFVRLWRTWWLGDAGGALVVAPAIIVWVEPSSFRWTRQQVAEAVLGTVILVALSGGVFGVPYRWGQRTYPLPFALPFLAWVAFRLGRRGTATAVVALSAIAIWGTLEGQGSFAQRDRTESLLLLQIFLAVSSATAFAVAASVNERKEAERSLALLAAALESSEDAVTVLNLDGTIARWNKAAEQLYGYPESEVRGRPITIVIPEELRREEEAILSRLVRGERIERYETRRRRKDGTPVDVWLTMSPVKDPGGRIVAASTTARDITERKRAREEIVRLNAELERRVRERTARLEAAIRELESFTYTVAHDLRAPLRAIHQFCDLLLEEKSAALDDEGQGWMHSVTEGARRMDALIEGLLAYSRIGREEIEMSTQSPSVLAREIVQTLAGVLRERRAQVEVDPALPPVRGNRLLLAQALTNLIVNSIKFVPPDRDPRVRLTAAVRGKTVRLIVEDNGIGIDPAHRNRLFRMFERLHPRENFPGTGIGLAIVKKAVEQMGGSVGFEPADGQGSRFFIDLPDAEGDAPRASET
jgi:PAS domain S-box-containing protein